MTTADDFATVRRLLDDYRTITTLHHIGGGLHEPTCAALDRIEAVVRAASSALDTAGLGVLRAEAERDQLREALRWYAERDDVNNYVAVAALSGKEPE